MFPAASATADINVAATATDAGGRGAAHADVAAATGFSQPRCLVGKDGIKVGPSGFVGAAAYGWKGPRDGKRES